MTRFERELSGSLGAYWKASAEKEIRKMEERQINGEIFFGADGVVRWTSNNRVMPKDCREILSHTAYIRVAIIPVAKIQKILFLLRIIHNPGQDFPWNCSPVGARA